MTRFITIILAGCAALAPTLAAQQWIDLFDGRTLDGWVQRGGRARYHVEDGAIVGTCVRGTPNSFLCTERTFGDFVLELEFRVHPRLNSGVQIRSESRPEHQKGRVHGYQVEIDPSARAWSGGIYDEGRRGWLFDLKKNEAARRAFRQGEWNRLHVEAVGDSIRTWINDVPAARLTDGMTARGFIGLQVHSVATDDVMQVRWRRLRLLDLDARRPKARLTHGPFLGSASETEARVWARAESPGTYTLVVEGEGIEPMTVDATAREGGDDTLSWTVSGLAPDRCYRLAVRRGGEPVTLERPQLLRTAPPADAGRRVSLAFGSCANHDRFPEQRVWDRITAAGAEAIVLLGDTPYVDSTDLGVQRRRYRELYSVPQLAEALGRRPFHATWDDHDFGANDGDGRLAGKAGSRRAFLEYHAGFSYGADGEGVFGRLRWGPVEVFLLDTRWFSGVEASPHGAGRGLLGARQWAWLERGLAASTAPFKIIASGMVWNGAVRPDKKDHWMAYPGERRALLAMIGRRRITGVVLLAGDIHRSRVLRYPTRDLAGYALTEIIASPLANTVGADADVPSPYLLRDAAARESFVLLSADRSRLEAACITAGGRRLFEVTIDADDLRRRP